MSKHHIGTWTSDAANISEIACYYDAEQVQVNVTYSLPEQTIAALSPLRSSVIPNAYQAYPFSSPSINAYLASENNRKFDNLFLAALNGSDASTFLTQSNAPLFASRVSHIYNIFITQYFTSLLRSSVNMSESSQLQGTLIDPNRQRLYQSKISTRILEGLLAAMWICTVVAFVLFDARELLPNIPCSIVAQASLFADSELLGLITPGSEHCTSKELMQMAPFKDHVFSLGWWDKSDGSRRFGIDVGRADAQDDKTEGTSPTDSQSVSGSQGGSSSQLEPLDLVQGEHGTQGASNGTIPAAGLDTHTDTISGVEHEPFMGTPTTATCGGKAELEEGQESTQPSGKWIKSWFRWSRKATPSMTTSASSV